MTDLEKLVALLSEFGVGHLVEDGDVYVGTLPGSPISADACRKVTGYSGFYTHFEFDDEGKFIQVGAWE